MRLPACVTSWPARHAIAIDGSDEASVSSNNSTRRGARAFDRPPRLRRTARRVAAGDRAGGQVPPMDVAAGDRFQRRGWMRRMPRRFPWRARAVGGRFISLASRRSIKKTCPSSSQSCGGSTFRSGAASHAGTAGVARSVPTIRGALGQPACRPSSPTPSRSAIGGMRTRSPSRASLGPAGACLPAWAGSSTRRPLCRRPNASPGISTASSRLCSPSCGPPTSTRPTGAPNTPSAPPSLIARSVAGIGRPAAHGPNRSSRVWSEPRVNAMSTSTTSSPRCCGRRGRWSPRLFASRRCRITRETKTLM